MYLLHMKVDVISFTQQYKQTVELFQWRIFNTLCARIYQVFRLLLFLTEFF